MTIYSFHLFDRNCDPQITHHFHGKSSDLGDLDAAKLLFGTIHSLRHLTRQLSPNNPGDNKDNRDDADDRFVTYKTSHYALHSLETPSLLRFMLFTSPDIQGPVANHILNQVYAGLYVEYCVKNPLSLSCLYSTPRKTILETHRFGAIEGQSRAQKKRRDEIIKRESVGDAGQQDRGTGKDFAMVMGCELFILALEQFMQQLPGFD